MFVMPPCSHTGLGPNKHRQLDVYNSEPLPSLEIEPNPQMMKYERHLAVDEGYSFLFEMIPLALTLHWDISE